MATILVDGGVAREPRLTIRVQHSGFLERPLASNLREVQGLPHVEVRCGNLDPRGITVEDQEAVHETLVELLATISGRCFVFAHTEETLRKLVVDEQGMTRAATFAASHFVVGNVLGDSPKTSLADWATGPVYSLRRNEVWDASDRLVGPKVAAEPRATVPLQPGTGEPPPDLFNLDQMKHSNIKVVSLIREPLWKEAGWLGTMFEVDPVGRYPPVMAPMFRRGDSARLIFEGWRKELGEGDPQDRLRVTVVTGISKTIPYSYRLLIGSNPDAAMQDEKVDQFVSMYQVHTMLPESDLNLRRFLEMFRRVGAYVLAPAVWEEGAAQPRVLRENVLLKRQLRIREAWQIGRNDWDSPGILPEDDPIIPEGEANAPVAELLKWKRNKRTG